MPVAKPVSSDCRVIAHIDMDCFYVQVEQRKRPELRGLPTAVVQYNSWQGGGLIAVSYEARKFGVKRSMRGDEAKKVCPEIQLVQVPVARGKADLNIYRTAGSEVISILSRTGRCERASIDEVYLDLTDAAETMLAERPPECIESIDDEALKSHVLGLSQDGDVKDNVKHWFRRSDADHYDKLLACGAMIVAELRAQVLRETEFTCSAGIAHNKMLAKLASGMNKPAQQTIVPSTSVKELLGCLPIKKMKQLGGKLGDSLQSDLGVNTVGDLLQFSEGKLQEHYGINSGTWLWNIARGISGEEVEGRILPKSHGSGKTFPGPRALKTLDSVEHWLRELCEELNERLLADLDQNKRVAHTLIVHARAYKLNDTDSQKKFPSKSCPLRYGVAKIQEDAHNLFQAGLREFMGVYGDTIDKNKKSGWGVTGLSVSASKILAIPPGTCSITKFFRSQNSDDPTLLDTPSDKINSVGLPKAGNDDGSESKQSIESKEDPPTPQSILQENLTRDSSELELKRKSQNTQGTRSVIELLQSQSQFRSSLNQSTLGETSCSMRHETVGWSANSQIAAANVQHKDEPTCSLGNPSMKQGQGRNKSKGTSSILKFMKATDHPSSDVANTDSASCSAGAISEHTRPSQEESRQGNERWSLNPSEIDPAVFDELPPDIQEEVRAWFRPAKQSFTATGRSRITGFFSPTKEAN